MSLADQLSQVAPQINPQGCKTCLWYADLPDGDKRSFDEWVEAGYQKTQLLEACRKEGLNVCESSFSRHLRGKCRRGAE